MAKISDCSKKRYQRLNASADMEAPTILEDKQMQWQDGDLANGILSATELTRNSGKRGVIGKDVAEHDRQSQQNEVGVRKESTQLVFQRLKQTEKHGKKVIAKRKWLSANSPTNPLDNEKDPAGLQQLRKLKVTVERLGGKLDDGWHVTSQRRSKNGLPFFRFTSPTKERFRSRIEVVRYLGLPARPAKNRFISDQQIKNHEGLGHVGKVVSHAPKASEDVNDQQLTSAPSFSASVITQRCQDILRSIISTEIFAAVSNMVSRGAPSPSMDATLQLKGPSFLASSLDLKLIHLRLSTGAYGQSPELFSTDIQQVWKNIIAAGNELVMLAGSLSELSESLYKQQVLSLFDGTPKRTVHASNCRDGQSIDDTYVHVPLPERIIARGPDDNILREFHADVFVEDHANTRNEQSIEDTCVHVPLPVRHAAQARAQKQLPTKARYQSDNNLHKTIGKAKDRLTSQCRLSCASTDSHTEIACELGTFNKGIWDEERQKEILLTSSNATTEICQGLQISTGKAGICEACKKEDDNVLLCDACDAAYHMNCLSPPIESVPDGCWYCPACDEAGKRLMVLQQDSDVHNCAVCERVSREHMNCAENESTARVLSKDTSPAYLVPEHTMDHEYQDCNLDQGVSELCVENKAMDSDFFSGTGNVCKFCGLDEGKTSISCSNCQNYYHLSCLRPALRKRPRKTWFCPSCLCRVCKIDVDDDKILLCDVCDEGYHTYCLTPPLSKIPEEAWFCSSCMPRNTPELKKKLKSNEPRRL
ncbi:hypothetical protein GOP47_0005537 [Adiantum capillus-veneris]|uniref:PHD-type domain-containing protein n=1 Tax=Adiantum capillus-veneris TaxID=13818 RepID=A0A9D4V6G3_ADICA|nr:hypothetical protein GOP47_0005537 [Adiantum capillus-veneris]